MNPTILVTGATDGIGKQTAIELARAGASVIVHGRSQAKCDAAAQEVRASAASVRVDTAVFDLSSLRAVRAGAALLAKQHPKLDVLINNAGIYLADRRLTEDGFEATFAVNHLAPFLLTHLLLPQLAASGAGRVVNVSSMVHFRARLVLEDLDAEHWFSGYSTYGQSKLANVLFTVELAERLGRRPITTNSLHPGVIATKLLREGFGSMGGGSLHDGAATSVYLALSPDVAHVSGRYFSSSREANASPLVSDRELRRQLWDVSAERCGLADSLPLVAHSVTG